MEIMEKGRQLKNIGKNMKYCTRKSEKKNEMKPKRSGSTFLSMGIDSSKGINFNTWALKSQTADAKL